MSAQQLKHSNNKKRRFKDLDLGSIKRFKVDTNLGSTSKQKLITPKKPTKKDNLISKTDDSTALEKSSLTKKKKRPWRAKVRREARKKRLAAERAEQGKFDITSSTEQPNNVEKKKKKKLKKKKKKSLLEISSENKTSIPLAEKINSNNKMNVSEKLEASRFRYLNEHLYTSTSDDAENFFAKDRSLFEAYHRGYRIQVSKWPINPLDFIIRDLETLPTNSVIADLGCGEAKLAEKLQSKYTVYSYDLVSINDRVVACNIAKLPLEKESVNAVVFCLSLMGTNLSDFIREANRILKKGGKLKIAEVTSRFRSVPNFITALEKMGFRLKRKKELESYFILLTLEKIGGVVEKRPKGLILDPCLYKKR